MSNKHNERAARNYFEDEKKKFIGLLQHAQLVGNRVGNRETDELRVLASWLYMRTCVMGNSIVQILDPPPIAYGPLRYLDHASIASLCRALIESIVVLIYLSDATASADEWSCRRSVVDLHDFVNRSAFLLKLNTTTDHTSKTTLEKLRKRIEENKFFQSLPAQRQERLLGGDDMFVGGRHAAMLELGWGDDFMKAAYKYLSNQAHSMPMSFHRTAYNQLYKDNSGGARVVAAFALTTARLALGTALLHMVELFPDIELSFDPIVFAALKASYGRELARLPATGA